MKSRSAFNLQYSQHEVQISIQSAMLTTIFKGHKMNTSTRCEQRKSILHSLQNPHSPHPSFPQQHVQPLTKARANPLPTSPPNGIDYLIENDLVTYSILLKMTSTRVPCIPYWTTLYKLLSDNWGPQLLQLLFQFLPSTTNSCTLISPPPCRT